MFMRDARYSVLSCLMVLLTIAGCAKPNSEESAEDKLPADPVPVQAVKVERTTLKPSIDLVGTLVSIPEKTTSVSPQIAGWIQKVVVVEGNRVHAGDELVHLDSRLLEADQAKATASVEEASAVLERLKHGPRPEEIEVARNDARKAKVAADALRSQVEALKPLRDRNEIPLLELQRAQSSLQAAEADEAAAVARLKLLEAGTRPEEIAEAEARLAAAKADLAAARLNVELCNVTSPIDGIITQLAARKGMYVDGTATLATIVDLSKVFAQIRIPSAYLAKVKPAAAVDVRLTSLPERTFRGKIARISGQADPTTGDVDALAEVANEEGLLRPGLACQGRLWLPEIADALVVPATAIADRSGTPVVSVIRDGRALEIAVKLGVQTKQQTQVIEGLSPGDMVITEGGYDLPGGCPVRVVEGGDKTGAAAHKR